MVYWGDTMNARQLADARPAQHYCQTVIDTKKVQLNVDINSVLAGVIQTILNVRIFHEKNIKNIKLCKVAV